MHKRRKILRRRRRLGSSSPEVADNGNVYQAWKGAVEPDFASGSGNEYQCWKGAVEPGE
jgi:hypothetical protein